ncbi:MAG TPA: hypothetical protein GX518_01970 [Firmicutes bacterium]|nr:hypothetical protein [Bacillota bacterium]
MEDATILPAQEDLEACLTEVRGISAARVVIAKGQIEAIHILAEPDRNPKQVVRDVESALQARFGIDIDHKKISVAQVNGQIQFPPSARPRLVAIGFTASNNRATARVELEFGRDLYEGEAEGPNTSFNKLRLTAAAALKAIESFTRQRCTFLLEDVAVVPTGRWETAVVVVTALTQGREERLAGAVLVEGDRAEAVVKATLSAVNRRLSFLSAK